ncbi:MAG: NAD(P)/FAD-dependent oxidoreductase [Chitinophagaceae bacterium]|nr:NAD(P)/FAD-dependent oxidoreductase [Anaerolineae bacterium]
MFDVIIIGGGPAGLSAGLTLGRFRRSVLICDGQHPRNAKSTGVHGFFSRDGIHPQELLKIAREQLTPYSTVQVRSQEVIDIVQSDAHFTVYFQDGASELAKKILFATGVKDVLPAIDDIDALWGKSVYHCPYCHGWEARDKAIAVLANGDASIHYSKLLHSLSNDIVICTNGRLEMSNSERLQLDRLGINITETPILHLKRQDTTLEGIVFTDGSYLQRDVIFVRPAQIQHSLLPAKLGCAMTENGFVDVDEQGKTSIEGVYAAGDLTSMMQQVLFAASRGAASAAGINYELAHEAFIREVN